MSVTAARGTAYDHHIPLCLRYMVDSPSLGLQFTPLYFTATDLLSFDAIIEA